MTHGDAEKHLPPPALTDEFKAEIQLVFNLFDTDKNKTISVSEFVGILSIILHMRDSPAKRFREFTVSFKAREYTQACFNYLRAKPAISKVA